MNKKIISGTAVVLLTIMAVVWLLNSKIDNVVSSIIEDTASNVLKTTAKISNLSVDMKQGKASIGELAVANLDGYAREHILIIKGIACDLDTTFMQENLLVIESMRVDSAQIFYESTKPNDTNMHALLKNIMESSIEPGKTSESKGLKIVIKKLEIGAGVITANSTKPEGKIVEVGMPPVEIFNIGQAQGGLSTKEAFGDLAGELVNTVLRTATATRLDLSVKPVNKEWIEVIRKHLDPDS